MYYVIRLYVYSMKSAQDKRNVRSYKCSNTVYNEAKKSLGNTNISISESVEIFLKFLPVMAIPTLEKMREYSKGK